MKNIIRAKVFIVIIVRQLVIRFNSNSNCGLRYNPILSALTCEIRTHLPHSAEFGIREKQYLIAPAACNVSDGVTSTT